MIGILESSYAASRKLIKQIEKGDVWNILALMEEEKTIITN